MNAAKSGILAQFKTGYLQTEIRVEAKVTGGTDTGLRDSSKTGFAVGRLVKLQGSGSTLEVAVPSGVTATSIGDATHIIAQSDDTIRDVPEDYNYTERYSYLPNLICKNDTNLKTVALYKITNTDDIKLINLD